MAKTVFDFKNNNKNIYESISSVLAFKRTYFVSGENFENVK